MYSTSFDGRRGAPTQITFCWIVLEPEGPPPTRLQVCCWPGLPGALLTPRGPSLALVQSSCHLRGVSEVRRDWKAGDGHVAKGESVAAWSIF